jgi:hypothetical protein
MTLCAAVLSEHVPRPGSAAAAAASATTPPALTTAETRAVLACTHALLTAYTVENFTGPESTADLPLSPWVVPAEEGRSEDAPEQG